MPLNIEDSEDKKRQGPEKPPQRPAVPVTPDGPTGGGPGTKILLWILLAIVLVSLVFLLIQFGVIPAGERGAETATTPRTEEPAPTVPPPDTTASIVPPASQDSIRRAELRKRLLGEGSYTVYISAFRAESDAGELAGRWTAAGYNAFVVQSDGWYRVALGRYAGENEAREEAEKLKQALEVGYWIGTADRP